MKLKHKKRAPAKPRRVFLVDPFSISRLSVADWLRRTDDLAVCGHTDSPDSGLKAIRKLKPDIVVTEMSSLRDFYFIQKLHREQPRLPILVFSSGNNSWAAPRALEAGADGYLLKGAHAEGLVDGIRRALEGRVVLGQRDRYQLLKKCSPLWVRQSARRQPLAPREKKSVRSTPAFESAPVCAPATWRN
jgi:DNA-binding NarL/FixJ family response regulator